MKRVLKVQTEPQALTDYKRRFADAPAQLIWTKFKKQTARLDPAIGKCTIRPSENVPP
jgi:hypothetical protein